MVVSPRHPATRSSLSVRRRRRTVTVKLQSEGMGGDYVLSLAAGRFLRIPQQFEADSLRRLLSVLEALR